MGTGSQAPAFDKVRQDIDYRTYDPGQTIGLSCRISVVLGSCCSFWFSAAILEKFLGNAINIVAGSMLDSTLMAT